MIEFVYYIKGFTFDNSKSKSPLKKALIKIKSLNSLEEPSFSPKSSAAIKKRRKTTSLWNLTDSKLSVFKNQAAFRVGYCVTDSHKAL